MFHIYLFFDSWSMMYHFRFSETSSNSSASSVDTDSTAAFASKFLRDENLDTRISLNLSFVQFSRAFFSRA